MNQRLLMQDRSRKFVLVYENRMNFLKEWEICGHSKMISLKKNTITTQGRRISLQSRGMSAWQIEQPERYVREQKTEAQVFRAS